MKGLPKRKIKIGKKMHKVVQKHASTLIIFCLLTVLTQMLKS